MCWFYMGIAQIALEHPPPLLSNGQTWKKVPQTILTNPYTPGQRGKKVPQTILVSPYTPVQTCEKKWPPMPIYGNNTFQKGASLSITIQIYRLVGWSVLQFSIISAVLNWEIDAGMQKGSIEMQFDRLECLRSTPLQCLRNTEL